jgi:hypothetical protein
VRWGATYVVQGRGTSGHEEDARQACMHLPRRAVFVNWKRPVWSGSTADTASACTTSAILPRSHTRTATGKGSRSVGALALHQHIRAMNMSVRDVQALSSGVQTTAQSNSHLTAAPAAACMLQLLYRVHHD